VSGAAVPLLPQLFSFFISPFGEMGACDELNLFLRSHRIVNVEKRLVDGVRSPVAAKPVLDEKLKKRWSILRFLAAAAAQVAGVSDCLQEAGGRHDG
jgi:hypothetical protein